MQPWWVRFVIIAILIAIVASLGSALYQLSRRGGGDSRKMFRSLILRVGLSVGLFILLLLGWLAGVIQPHGI